MTKRASGFYANPDHLAGLLEALGILGLSIACWARRSRTTRVVTGYLAAWLVLKLAFAVTASRGGYLSAVVSLLILSASRWHLLISAWKRPGLSNLSQGSIDHRYYRSNCRWICHSPKDGSTILRGRVANICDRTGTGSICGEPRSGNGNCSPCFGTT